MTDLLGHMVYVVHNQCSRQKIVIMIALMYSQKFMLEIKFGCLVVDFANTKLKSNNIFVIAIMEPNLTNLISANLSSCTVIIIILNLMLR